MALKKKKSLPLQTLTGLSQKELAEVFTNNPRAYMSVRGAVAEKHLEKLIESWVIEGNISSYRGASGDFDKDFYITLPSGDEISLECKNVQVLGVNNKLDCIDYLLFLLKQKYLELSQLQSLENKVLEELGTSKDLEVSESSVQNQTTLQETLLQYSAPIPKGIISRLPPSLKNSGVPRYEFSASKIPTCDIFELDESEFLEQFSENPVSIDFQKTRNSTDKSGDTKSQRLYQKGEIDVVGACLFSRTMGWKFLFGHAGHFEMHDKYLDRYKSKLELKPGFWFRSFFDVVPSVSSADIFAEEENSANK